MDFFKHTIVFMQKFRLVLHTRVYIARATSARWKVRVVKFRPALLQFVRQPRHLKVYRKKTFRALVHRTLQRYEDAFLNIHPRPLFTAHSVRSVNRPLFKFHASLVCGLRSRYTGVLSNIKIFEGDFPSLSAFSLAFFSPFFPDIDAKSPP